ncbi:hypothetical protein GCM10010975_37430 [Comamonas phosphati]|nr:hypothetical protein GCM10010975_37430 [Comamonas phosphati]
MKRKNISLIAAAMCLVIAGFWISHTHLGNSAETAKAARADVKAARNESGVALDQEERERAGITTAAVQSIELQAQSSAIASVLPLQELIDAAASIAAARAQDERAKAAVAASRRDFERLQGLHAQDRNVSDRALEAAEATWRGDEAAARASVTALDAARSTVRARWGAVLADSLAARGPLWRHLESGRSLLLRVTATSGAAPSALPPAIEVEDPDGKARKARLISRAPISDARIQGQAYWYETDAAGLAPGMSLTSRFGAGALQTGALLPPEALLWWQGRQWAYVEAEPGRFERREATAALRVERGWFVPGFPELPVVSRGAQALLSQELKSTLQAGEDDK